MQIEKIANSIGVTDKIKILKMKYGLEILKNELIKFSILFVVFAAGGFLYEFVFALLILLPMRFFSGGLHMTSNIHCFLLTLSFFMLGIVILPLIKLELGLAIAILSLSSILIIAIGPIASQKRPISTKERYAFLKRNSILAIVIECIALVFVLLFLPYNYFIIGVWIFCLQAFQLVISKIILHRKERGLQ